MQMFKISWGIFGSADSHGVSWVHLHSSGIWPAWLSWPFWCSYAPLSFLGFASSWLGNLSTFPSLTVPGWLNQCYSIPSNTRAAPAPAASTDLRGLCLRSADGLDIYRENNNNNNKGFCVRCEIVTRRWHLSKHGRWQNVYRAALWDFFQVKTFFTPPCLYFQIFFAISAWACCMCYTSSCHPLIWTREGSAMSRSSNCQVTLLKRGAQQHARHFSQLWW